MFLNVPVQCGYKTICISSRYRSSCEIAIDLYFPHEVTCDWEYWTGGGYGVNTGLRRLTFSTLLELNSNIEWWNHYVDYDALKKLFPSNPLDPSSYLSTVTESTSILPVHRGDSKYATPPEFRSALDREREKVSTFYLSKISELHRSLEQLEEEIESEETAELVDADDTIAEVNEDGDEAHALLGPPSPSISRARKQGILSRLAPNGMIMGRRRSLLNKDEADVMEGLSRGRSRSIGTSGNGNQNQSSPLLEENQLITTEEDLLGSPIFPTKGKVPPPRNRAMSDLESSDADIGRERRLSVSSASSHGDDYGWPRKAYGSLKLVPMDRSALPSWTREESENEPGTPSSSRNAGVREKKTVYIWKGDGHRAQMLKIQYKKRISALWLEAYGLKQYVDLNLTAFEKILKKYDKNTSSKVILSSSPQLRVSTVINQQLKNDYLPNVVLTSRPWVQSDRDDLDNLISHILLLYRRIVTSGNEDQAKDQLRAQLREKVVVDRETVWSQMVSGHRGQGIFRSIEPDEESVFKPDPTQRSGKYLPGWLSRKVVLCLLALGVLVIIVQTQPVGRVEESNCLAMLLFCTILWATEAIPLFVTSLAVPFLVVILRVLRSSDGEDTRLSASDATKYIFSQMFSPTIMLLIGGFTIAAVLSKTRLDVMTATRILNAAGTRPSVVLLVLMSVATFASMWISNVAAPTLCYALIKPILDELHPKSMFSKCLIIAIALASNIGGQASPISSPQNLIALGSMDPPLSWPEWFAISIPVSSISVIAIWAFLHLNYRWENDLRIPKMRKNTDALSKTHYFVLFISALTIGLWCAEKSMEGVVGDMGVIAVIPLLAFFGTGILSKEDFHSFHWSIVFLAMGGIALGKATLSSGLLDDLDHMLEGFVEGMGLYSILIVFSILALVIATFISHTIAAVLLVPIATRIGDSLDEPHPKLLIMATALICSAGMGLPVSGFPNMTAITQENKLGQRFIGAIDFLKNGVPSSLLATFVSNRFHPMIICVPFNH
ncbi:phosphate transporter [Tremella mesenterica]|uniref:Phosphate transporter n=1 Tax=Tremella mesenterica TaxID=5217 RepID=A0A4Q1BT81_TREME|nr:phosphate transporter [Tremella mesenterica]